MIIRYEPTGSVEGFTALSEEMARDDNVNGLLVLACDNNGFSPDVVDDILNTISVPVFGGIFPAIIYGRQKLDKGTIIVGLNPKPSVFALPNLSDMDIDYDEAIQQLVPHKGAARTVFIFVDGYSKRIMPMIDSLYTIFGIGLNYIGGGAGSINPEALDMQHTPCLITNGGLIKDAAVLAFVEMDTGVGAGHGWHKISGPYKVTESDGNLIKTLDLRPAIEVYREIILQHSGKHIMADNFFDIAKHYPFGISRLDSEVVVRDPYTMEGDHLVVATPIPNESFIDILSGDPDSLVDAARRSFNAGRQTYPGSKPECVFMIDCISRVLYLDDDFDKEIAAVSEDSLPLIGILSMGEIANTGKDYMEFYNKTCVVGILGEQ